MKKLLFVSLFLVACGKGGQNVAEMRVKSDVPNAKCASGKLSDGTFVTKCELPREDGKGTVSVLAGTGGEYPFQAFPFKTQKQITDERKASADQPSPIAAPATGSAGAQLPTAGSASAGSGSGSGK